MIIRYFTLLIISNIQFEQYLASEILKEEWYDDPILTKQSGEFGKLRDEKIMIPNSGGAATSRGGEFNLIGSTPTA